MDENTPGNKERGASATVIRWSATGIVGVLALAYLLAVPLGIVDRQDRLSTAELIFAGALLFGLVFGDRLDELRLGSFAVTLRQVERRQKELEKAFGEFSRHVDELFLHTMAGTAFKNLQSLALARKDGEGPIRPFDESHMEDLIREMKLLRDL